MLTKILCSLIFSLSSSLFQTNTPPIFSCDTDYIEFEYGECLSFSEVINRFNIKAFDKEDNIYTLIKQYGPIDFNLCGEEQTLKCVTSDSNKSYSYFSIPLKINYSIPPIIECGDIISYDASDSLTLDYIISKSVFAYSEAPSQTNNTITISYTSNSFKNNIPGHYPVEINAKDKFGNTSSKSIIVDVIGKDNIPPIIQGPTSLTVEYGTFSSFIDIVNIYKICAYDEYDQRYVDIIQASEFDSSKLNEEQLVKLSAKDSSNNYSYSSVSIIVKFTTPPTVYGSEIINMETTSIFNVDDFIKKYFICYSICPIENPLKTSICEGQINYLKEGVYPITISCVDSFGYETFFETEVHVVGELQQHEDTETPNQNNNESQQKNYLSVCKISTTTNNKLSTEDIINYLEKEQKFTFSSYEEYTVVEDYYSSSFDKVGNYSITISLRKDNEEYLLPILINVKKEKISFFKRISLFFSNIWKMIKSFFISIINFFKKPF